MANHCGYIVKVEKLRKHSNADRLQVATFFGNDVIVGLDTHIGDIGIYFPTDLQLSKEFAENNNLVRKKDDAGNNVGGFLDPEKRNIKAIKLRGEKSDGLYCPLSTIEYTGVDLSSLTIGDLISCVNGKEICRKYVPRTNSRTRVTEKEKNKKKAEIIAPLFKEHVDTEQLAYNWTAFKPNDKVEITLKMHGTSHRVGYLPVFKGYNDTPGERFVNPLIRLVNKVFKKNEPERHSNPIYEYDYVSGTRRTVLENFEGGYYGSNAFREPHTKFFEGKLWKGETVYLEIVGFTHNGVPIMPRADNKRTKDKEFIKTYGNVTEFSYGLTPPESEMYVYRMTMTNEDGDVIEYSPDFMRYRCEQIGAKTVPVLWEGKIPEACFLTELDENEDVDEVKAVSAGEWIINKAEEFYDGPDPIGKTHIREGVVVRILNRPKFTAYKHKSFYFKVLEGIIKEVAEEPDIEEAEG